MIRLGSRVCMRTGHGLKGVVVALSSIDVDVKWDDGTYSWPLYRELVTLR